MTSNIMLLLLIMPFADTTMSVIYILIKTNGQLHVRTLCNVSRISSNLAKTETLLSTTIPFTRFKIWFLFTTCDAVTYMFEITLCTISLTCQISKTHLYGNSLVYIL